MPVMTQVTLIRTIRLDELVFVGSQGHFRAVTVMATDTSTFCLIARHECDRTAPMAHVRQGLIADALRQLRQLPEYRNGTGRVVLALGGAEDRRQTA